MLRNAAPQFVIAVVYTIFAFALYVAMSAYLRQPYQPTGLAIFPTTVICVAPFYHSFLGILAYRGRKISHIVSAIPISILIAVIVCRFF
jgi:hypothetical protein